MTSLSDDNQADIIESFNSTYRYLDNLFDIENPYFEGMINQIYPLSFNRIKLILQILRPPFWIFIYLFLMVLFPPKFMINTTNLLFLMTPSYGVYISQLKRFARVFSHVEDFMLVINASLLNFSNMVIGIIRLERFFSKFYCCHYEPISKFNVD